MIIVKMSTTDKFVIQNNDKANMNKRTSFGASASNSRMGIDDIWEYDHHDICQSTNFTIKLS